MATTLEPRLARRSITLVHRAPLGPIDRERRSRRCLNIAAATVGIVLTLPLMLVIDALLKLTSRGPVLFTQPRLALDPPGLSRACGSTRPPIDRGGRPVPTYQFRTMP